MGGDGARGKGVEGERGRGERKDRFGLRAGWYVALISAIRRVS
jgi:hypothetical protein